MILKSGQRQCDDPHPEARDLASLKGPFEARKGSHLRARGLVYFFLLLLAALAIVAPASAKTRFSAISVDARTGKVLFASDPDGLRYPASLTKTMTLYILFEELKAGRLKLDSPISASKRSAGMEPSKLGVKAGNSIPVETAIKAIVILSANDIAAAIGENLSGSESAFAARMTATARRIGMSRTVFRNASGLPNPAQVTTARDMATLGLRVQRDFPQYYHYFRTMAFTYNGRTIRTHNRLLGKYAGTDGIKTGYIRASGFNLTSSAQRGKKRIVGVVMGGQSGVSRNAYMMKMLDNTFPHCTDGQMIAAMAGSSKDAIVPVIEEPAKEIPALATASLGAMIKATEPKDAPKKPEVVEAKVAPAAEPAKTTPETPHPKSIVTVLAEGTWNIQLGPHPSKKKAELRLRELKAAGLAELRDKPAFTVTVQQGKVKRYRTRFSGFSKQAAQAACENSALKKLGCYVVEPSS